MAADFEMSAEEVQAVMEAMKPGDIVTLNGCLIERMPEGGWDVTIVEDEDDS